MLMASLSRERKEEGRRYVGYKRSKEQGGEESQVWKRDTQYSTYIVTL